MSVVTRIVRRIAHTIADRGDYRVAFPLNSIEETTPSFPSVQPWSSHTSKQHEMVFGIAPTCTPTHQPAILINLLRTCNRYVYLSAQTMSAMEKELLLRRVSKYAGLAEEVRGVLSGRTRSPAISLSCGPFIFFLPLFFFFSGLPFPLIPFFPICFFRAFFVFFAFLD